MRKGWSHDDGYHRAQHHLVTVRRPAQVDIDAISTIELRKLGYPTWQTLAVEKVRKGRLVLSKTETDWPFEFETSCDALGDVVRNYERPVQGVEAISGRQAFYKGSR